MSTPSQWLGEQRGHRDAPKSSCFRGLLLLPVPEESGAIHLGVFWRFQDINQVFSVSPVIVWDFHVFWVVFFSYISSVCFIASKILLLLSPPIISPYLMAYVLKKILYCKSNVILGRHEIRCVCTCVHLYACVCFHINPEKSFILNCLCSLGQVWVGSYLSGQVCKTFPPAPLHTPRLDSLLRFPAKTGILSLIPIFISQSRKQNWLESCWI